MKKLKLQVKAFLLKLKAILTLPINQLIIFSALVFILSILMALSIIYFNHSKTFKLDNLGAIGSLLQGTLGIAVSLAGAYVAIKLAGLGYDILNKENKRDDYVIINDIVSSAINPIFKIAQEYEKLIDIFRKISDDDKFQRNIREVLEQAIEDSDFEIKPDDYKPKISNTLEADNDKDERDKKEIIPDLTFMNELGNQVSNLKGALEDIRSNQFSYFMFRELIDKNAKKSLLLKHSEPVVADDFNKLVFI